MAVYSSKKSLKLNYFPNRPKPEEKLKQPYCVTIKTPQTPRKNIELEQEGGGWPNRGVSPVTGQVAATMDSKIVMDSIIATPKIHVGIKTDSSTAHNMFYI